MLIYKAIYQTAENDDPFKEIKNKCTDILLSNYQRYQERIRNADNSIYEALRLAALGNAIDFGANPEFDLQKELAELNTKDFDTCLFDDFAGAIEKATRILLIADNAGETVFDRLLIEQINLPTFYAVRSRPIINDATYDDARRAGIHKKAKIIASGCDAPGTIIKMCSDEFIRAFTDADVVISKGQGNYETLSDQKRKIFFLLKIKCPVIAQDINLKLGSVALITNNHE